MGKTMVRIKLWNVFEEEKVSRGETAPLEVEAQVDNGAVRMILPQTIVEKLNLRKSGKVKVRYADMRTAEKDVVIGLRIEISGRDTETTAIVEPQRDTPLIGQIILEDLDLGIDSKNGKLIPNPESPDMPLLDEL